MQWARTEDTIERSGPCWKLGHSKTSNSGGRAIKNLNPYASNLQGGFEAWHAGENLDMLPHPEATDKTHVVGHGKRNFAEKFSSSVFTSVYEEDLVKGPCKPANVVAKPNTQLPNKVDKLEALRGRNF